MDIKDIASEVVDYMIASEGVSHTESYRESALAFHTGAISRLVTADDVENYVVTYVPGNLKIESDILAEVINRTACEA